MQIVNQARIWTAVILMSAGLLRPCGAQSEHRLKLDLDPLLDLETALALTPSSIGTRFNSPDFRENPFIHWDAEKTKAVFSPHPYSNVAVALSILNGSSEVSRAEVAFAEGRAALLTLVLPRVDQAALGKLREKLNSMLGCSGEPGPKPNAGWRSERQTTAEIWKGQKAVGLMTSGSGPVKVSIAPAGRIPAAFATPFAGTAEGAGGGLEFFVRLDQMFAAPGLWSLGPEAIEGRMGLPALGLKENPFYKWNTDAKDSLLLTRHVFSNTSTDLLLFNDEVNAEEASLDFRGGKAAKLTVTLLSRGNSGEGGAASSFDTVFKAVGRALCANLGVRPTRTVPAGKSLTKIEGYLWTTPHTLALLEYNAEAPAGRVEFLRLKMMPASGRAELLNLAGIGNNATTRSRSSLTANVKRDAASGDIYIAGVPMIDQGQKGYCVSASCARVFNYLGVPCDQNDIAKLVKNDAQGGTSPSVMYSALRKIEQEYNMRVKVMKLPRGYGLEGMTVAEAERAQKGDLTKLMQENIGLGLPLLWAVQLPINPVRVRTGFPGAATPVTIEDQQSGGGHMRLIIGFNAKTGDIIFTDSWGAGHEIKRMSLRDAAAMTEAVFTMQPAR